MTRILIPLLLAACAGTAATRAEVLGIMKRVDAWQVAHPLLPPEDRNWERGTWYTGVMAAWRATRDPAFLEQALAWGKQHGWQVETKEQAGADRIFCAQTWADLYLVKKDRAMIEPIVRWLDTRAPNSPGGAKRWYSWKYGNYVDALYAAPLFPMLARATGDRRYLDLGDAMFHDITADLFDKQEALYYRDNRFKGQKSAAGNRVFWSRGNGWAAGAIVRMLEYLPARDPRRGWYEDLLRSMAASIARRQRSDGLWGTNLADPETMSGPETSGSGFFCYALAWGINHRLLDRRQYLPAVERAWDGLRRSVDADGKVLFGQKVADRPDAVPRESTHEYVTGAFLLAASEIYGLAPSLPLFEQTDLFRQGEAGVHTYRIPALIETRKGTLIAVADARHDSSSDLPGRITLVMRRSFDRGRTWSAAHTIRKPPEGSGVGDASLLLDRRTGRVWCFHAYAPPGIGFRTSRPGTRTGPTTLQVHAMHSDDDGATWSEPADLTPQLKEPAWRGLFATSGTHFQTRSGRFLVPLVVRDSDGAVSARNAYSDDGGRTWKSGASAGPDTDESKAVERGDGTILQNMRDGPRRAVAISSDGGAAFGPLSHDEALIDPGCNAGLARYRRHGRDLLIFTNAASAKRQNLTVKVSRDGGRTWPVSRVLHAGPAAYSTVLALADGTVAVLYEGGDSGPYERITFARFALGWIER